jgi:hypothetical protein
VIINTVVAAILAIFRALLVTTVIGRSLQGVIFKANNFSFFGRIS